MQQKQFYDIIWDALPGLELKSGRIVSKKLANLQKAVRYCIEAGSLVGFVKGSRHYKIDISIAARYLKRVLTDLRSVWLLISAGYTSQAASVAASLHEHALTVNMIAGSTENTEKLLRYKSDDLPWSVERLSQNYAHIYYTEKYGKEYLKEHKDDYELTWRYCYYGYKFLCKIKHPTRQSVEHDTTASEVPDGWVITAYPNTKEKDNILKGLVLSIALNRSYDAIRSFVISLECDQEDKLYKELVERLDKLTKHLDEHLSSSKSEKLPFDISDSEFCKELDELNKRVQDKKNKS